MTLGLEEARLKINADRERLGKPLVATLGTEDDTVAINDIIRSSVDSLVVDKGYVCEGKIVIPRKNYWSLLREGEGCFYRLADPYNPVIPPWEQRRMAHVSVVGGVSVKVNVKVRGMNTRGGPAKDRTQEEKKALALQWGVSPSQIPSINVLEAQSGVELLNGPDTVELCDPDIADVYGDNFNINSMGGTTSAKNVSVYGGRFGNCGRAAVVPHGVVGFRWVGTAIEGWHNDIFHVEMQGNGGGRIKNEDHIIRGLNVGFGSKGYLIHITGAHDYDGLLVEQILREGKPCNFYATGLRKADGSPWYRNFTINSTHWDKEQSGGYIYRLVNVGNFGATDNEGPVRPKIALTSQFSFVNSDVHLGTNRLTAAGVPVKIPVPATT